MGLMENNIPRFTFAIASKNNFRYVKHAVKYIRENCYRKDHIIHIGIDGTDNELMQWVIGKVDAGDDAIVFSAGKKGIAAIYNDLATRLQTDFIVIYHADMIAGKNMDLNLYKQWKKRSIISATRVEPPLHPSDPSKIVNDFGLWPEENIDRGFQKESWNRFVENNLNSNKVTKGVFAPWLVHKEDYWAVGGHDEDLNSHSEDRDLFNRFLLKGFEFYQPWNALVYHLTCRGGQFQHAEKTEDLNIKSKEWNDLANNNTIKFIKKWGTPPIYNENQYPIVVPVYNKNIELINSNYQLEKALEPWFNGGKDITVYVDGNTFTQQDFQYIQQLNDIVKDSGEIGTFKLGNLTIEINSLQEYQNDLIFINNNKHK